MFYKLFDERQIGISMHNINMVDFENVQCKSYIKKLKNIDRFVKLVTFIILFFFFF